MKKSIILIVLVFTNFLLMSQSTDLDRELYEVSYVDLPMNPILDPALRTYTSNDSFLKIAGFSKVSNEGSINIEFEYFGTEITEVDIKKSKHEKTDKDGKVISTRYTYEVHVPYISRGKLILTDNVHYSNTCEKNYKETFNYRSSSFHTYSEAQNYYNNNRHNLREKSNSDHKSKIKAEIKAYLDRNFGYVIQNKKDVFFILDSKKHPETQKHKEAYEKAKLVFAKMKYDEPVDELKLEFKPIIDYFESVIPNYQGKKKKMKKMRFASYFNIAKIYYYLDDYKMVNKYAQKIIDNDHSKSNGKLLIKMSEDMFKRISANKKTSRHMKL